MVTRLGHAAPVTVDVRTLTAAELPRAHAMLERAFGGALHPQDVPLELSTVDPARFYAGWDGAEPVATAGSFDFTMTVPGGCLPVAGVSWVGVLPTYRRRGLLTQLMTRQLADLHEGGTAVAALWATEAQIYGRYGYGVAAWDHAVTVPRGAAFRVPAEPGGVRLVDPGSAELGEIYDRAAATTSGFPQRDEVWWAYRLHDPEHGRDGGSPLQCALTDGGYALYSTTRRFADGLPGGTVRVREVVAVTGPARARIWRYLLDLDLTSEVKVPVLAVDDPLLLDLLAEPRAAVALLRDCLHVRLIDVPAALAARRYAADVDVVLEVTDERCPWNAGRFRLAGGRDGATCQASTAEPDLVAAVADLGAAYLGGTPLRARPVVERTPGALARATTALGPLEGAPWCPQVF